MNKMVFANDLTERLDISKPSLYGIIRKLKLRKRTEWIKRDGRKGRSERCFTAEESILITDRVKRIRNKNQEIPPERASNQFHSYQRLWQWR